MTRDFRRAPASFRGEREAAAVFSTSPCVRKLLEHNHLRLPARARDRLLKSVALVGRNTALPPKSCAAVVAVQLSARGLVTVLSCVAECSQTGNLSVRFRSPRGAHHCGDLSRRLIGLWRCA